VKSERGYTLLEVLVAASITVLMAAAIGGMAGRIQATFASEPEAADMQQRLRVSADALARDLLNAGAGSSAKPQAGPLRGYIPAVVPYRLDAITPDAPGTFRDDELTVIYVPTNATETTITSDLSTSPSMFTVSPGPGCMLAQPACGFNQGDTALVYDVNGNFETFVIASTSPNGGTMNASTTDGAPLVLHKAGSKIVKAVVRAYFLKFNQPSAQSQLASYTGSGSELPVADHVVGIRFDYFGDPLPPSGPPPPPSGVQTTAYPPGENCAFTFDEHGSRVPRAADLSGATPPGALVRLSRSQLSDGPWCPDASSANRFDLDLLRIRMVAVTVRVESALDSMRGPASALFRRAGTAIDMKAALPDREITVKVSLRN
jgi:type II secretory pathway pseudopilin PulG